MRETVSDGTRFSLHINPSTHNIFTFILYYTSFQISDIFCYIKLKRSQITFYMSRCCKYVKWNNSTFISCGSRNVTDVSFPYSYKNHSILTLQRPTFIYIIQKISVCSPQRIFNCPLLRTVMLHNKCLVRGSQETHRYTESVTCRICER
jgi:hypothetical protein